MATGQPPQNTGLPGRPIRARTALAAGLGCACLAALGWYLLRTPAGQDLDQPATKLPPARAPRQPTEEEQVRAAVNAWFERQRTGDPAPEMILLTGGRDTPYLTDLRSWSVLHITIRRLDDRAGSLPPGDAPGTFLTGTAEAVVHAVFAYRPGLRAGSDVRITLRRYRGADGSRWQITAVHGLKR
jgi:hypothetical protein